MKLFKSWLLIFALCAVPVSLSADTLETVYFRGNMSPANEIPAVTNESAEATGKATIVVHARRADDGTLLSAVVDFDIDYNFPVPVTVRGLHIHEGGADVNGPVRINTGLSGSNTVDAEGTGNLFLQPLATDETQLAAVAGLLADPAGYYRPDVCSGRRGDGALSRLAGPPVMTGAPACHSRRSGERAVSASRRSFPRRPAPAHSRRLAATPWLLRRPAGRRARTRPPPS